MVSQERREEEKRVVLIYGELPLGVVGWLEKKFGVKDLLSLREEIEDLSSRLEQLSREVGKIHREVSR